MSELSFDNNEHLTFDDIDCKEDLLNDVDLEIELSDLYECIQQDVEECEEEEIANRVLTGLLEDAVTKLNISKPTPPFSSKALEPSQTISIPKQLAPTLSWKLEQLDDLFARNSYRIDDVSHLIKCSNGEFMVKWFSELGEGTWKNSVEFMKSLDGFSQLCEDDQVVLVKSAVAEFGTLFNAMMTDVEGTRMVFEDRQNQRIAIEVDSVLKITGLVHSNLINSHKSLFYRALRSCLPEWRMNRKLMLLLCAITLFNPDRQRLRDRCRVWKIQEFFYDLLRRYLAVLYPKEADARLAFVGLIGFLVAVRDSGKHTMKDFYNENVPFVRTMVDLYSSPLTRELLGITEC